MKCFVKVRLSDVDMTLEWREVEAPTLGDAIKVAERMPDVQVCVEAGLVPRGVPT